MASRKPRCFVAMAFNRDDTERLYSKAIKPVLDSLGIKAIIINRSQKNDDLTQQIVDQLEQADICVSDLTYARPSVYYEAGYAQSRKIPVIYTVRQDHLRKNQPDDLRVHFDLSVKNLIEWNPHSLGLFSKKLRTRISASFMTSYRRCLLASAKNRRETDAFSSLPIPTRLCILRQSSVRVARRLGFREWKVYVWWPWDLPLKSQGVTWSDLWFKNPAATKWRFLEHPCLLLGFKFEQGLVTVLAVEACHLFSQTILKKGQVNYGQFWKYAGIKAFAQRHKEGLYIRNVHISLVLSGVQRQTVHSALASTNYDANSDSYFEVGYTSGIDSPIHNYFSVQSAVRNVRDCEGRVRKAIESVLRTTK